MLSKAVFSSKLYEGTPLQSTLICTHPVALLLSISKAGRNRFASKFLALKPNSSFPTELIVMASKPFCLQW